MQMSYAFAQLNLDNRSESRRKCAWSILLGGLRFDRLAFPFLSDAVGEEEFQEGWVHRVESQLRLCYPRFVGGECP